MEDKKSFILYTDLISSFEILNDEEAGRLIKHILQYVNDLRPITNDKLILIAFEPIKQQLKRDLNKWNGIKTTKSEAGKQGGIKSGMFRKNKEKEANEADASFASKIEANEAVNVSVNVNGNVNVNDNVTGNVLKPKNDDFDEIKEILTGDIYLDEVCCSNSFDRLDFLQFTIQWIKDRKLTNNLSYPVKLLRLYCIEDFRKQTKRYSSFDQFKKKEVAGRTKDELNNIANEIAAEIEAEQLLNK